MPVSRLLAAAVPGGLPGARTLVHNGLGRIFGPPPFDPTSAPGDPGLFGPQSASWRIISEPASIIGGIRALIVQLLHPLAMAGVAAHSRYRDDPLGRLHRTSAYITTTTFGATHEALTAARRVQGAHRPVTGRAPSGQPYSAADPELLAWVSIALTSSFLATDRYYAPRPVDAATADAFVTEQSRAASLLDPRVDLDALSHDGSALRRLRSGTLPLPMVEDGTLPMSSSELTVALARYRPRLAVTGEGRAMLRFLLWPQLPTHLRAAYAPLLSGALASLDPPDRRLLGIHLGPAAAVLRAQTRALLTGVRLAAGRSPSRAAAARRLTSASDSAAATATATR